MDYNSAVLKRGQWDAMVSGRSKYQWRHVLTCAFVHNKQTVVILILLTILILHSQSKVIVK